MAATFHWNDGRQTVGVVEDPLVTRVAVPGPDGIVHWFVVTDDIDTNSGNDIFIEEPAEE